jgi:large subunit ribosomal protein L17
MRHLKSGRKFGRNSSSRKAMMRNLATSLFKHERIQTTDAKAKELRGFVERLITRAGKGTLHDRRLVLTEIHDKVVAKKLFDEIAPRYVERPGGYTRVTRVGFRKGDGAELAIIELIQDELAKKKRRRKRRKSTDAEAESQTAETAAAEQTEEDSSAEVTEPEAANAEDSSAEDTPDAGAEETSDEAAQGEDQEEEQKEE